MKRSTGFREARFDGKSCEHSRLPGGVTTSVAILALTAAFFCCLPGLCLGENSSSDAFSSVPLTFTQNQGQWPDDILFQANGGGAGIWITSTGVYYQFTRQIENANADVDDDPTAVRGPRVSDESDRTETMVIKAAFVGANPNPEVVAEGLMDYKCNYFLGNDPAKWRTDVPNYSSVVLKDIYPGIDVRFSENAAGRFTYEYDIAVGADVDQVQLQYEGRAEVAPDATGRMTAKTAWGDISGLLSRPSDNADPGFAADGQATSLRYPTSVSLDYSTFLGGIGQDRGYDVVVDAAHCAYVTGYTNYTDFPMQNPYDSSFNGTIGDVFVTKFSAAGNSLVYSTFLGGSTYDQGHDIAIDASGCAYVTGYTGSSDYPTQNAYDATYNSGTDAFVSKLSAAGNSLIYSTFLGSSSAEYGYGIGVDTSGCAYVTGLTNSSGFPMQNAYDASYSGGDAFVTKLSAGGNSLVYSTFLGGSSGEYGWDLAVDTSGCAYVTGETGSSDFPTQSAYDTTYNSGADGYVTKFSAAGNSLAYSTFLGGSSDDKAYSIAVDSSGSAYVTGKTASSDFPTQNAYDTSYNGSDAFVAKLSLGGDTLAYSTFLGGTGADEGWGIAVDAVGHAYVTGVTNSTNFPTANAYDASFGGGASDHDAFVTMVSAPGSSLIYSTYLGGSNSKGKYRDDDIEEMGCGIAVDDSNCAYVTGYTSWDNFPTTYNTFDTSYGGSNDAFVTKFNALCCVCPTVGNVDESPDCEVTMGDVSVLIDHLFITYTPLKCKVAGNINMSEDGEVTIGDVSALIDHLFITMDPLPACP